ncbi:hypothetical protein, partial [Acidovorax sp.]|uniref:hypothetical protein n=1 Tax=Acidovorax sp. TaxID=1872122 RepID=UPI0025C707DE
SALAMQLNTLQLKNKSINLEPGLPLLIGTAAGGRSTAPDVCRRTKTNRRALESKVSKRKVPQPLASTTSTALPTLGALLAQWRALLGETQSLSLA